MTHKGDLRVHVVGAGLIGTSVALASKERGHLVTIEDKDPHHQALARDLLGEKRQSDWFHDSKVEIVVVAVPPTAVASVVEDVLGRYPSARVIDVASVKTKVVDEVKGLSDSISRFIPTHPIAGRQFGGPASAQSDLFRDRPWVVTPCPENQDSDLDFVTSFAEGLGAIVHRMTPEHHDYLFAQISHLPQVVSTLLAAGLLEVGQDVALSGQGLRDVTRLADSRGDLWSEIIASNREELLTALSAFIKQLTITAHAIDQGDWEQVTKIFDQGNQGRALFSGKHGGKPRNYVNFRVIIEDKPGVLAELFFLCGDRGINIEDLTIEHSPNQETGLITLAISPDQEANMVSALEDENWTFHVEKRSVGNR